MPCKHRLCVTRILSCFLLCLSILHADPAPWTFNPPAVGKALQSGGWSINYTLGNVDACPEFTFPLQLIYQSTKTQEGLFGSGWFCPQLESSILPVAKGFLLWTTPSGGQIALEQNPDHNSEYRSANHQWKAAVSPSKQIITNEEGWQYLYSKGKLETIGSPGKRVLEFEWNNNQLQGIQVRDLGTHNRRLLLLALYGDNKRLSSLKLDGQLHKFAYIKDGTAVRLSAWAPPVGETMKFLYQPDCGVLAKIGIGNTEDPQRIEDLKTVFVPPPKADTGAGEATAKKQAANYWLIADRGRTYTYGRTGNKNDQWNAADVTATYRTGQTEKVSYAEARSIVTTQHDGSEQKNYYYRSPGQKYDGKLRRVEQNGKLIAEYRYDRKSGLLTETIDDQGVSTYFDYDSNFRPSKRPDWDPKPLRVRRGNLRKSEVIAQYAYSDDGKLIAAKNKNGDLTRYTYNSRGEVISITNPAGNVINYTYDDFGRTTSVSAAGRTERVAYDDYGRVKLQLGTDGSKTEVIYDADGQVAQIKHNDKVTKELVRDEFHRVVGEKDPLNRLSRIERDVRGNVTAEIAANGSITRYEYDASDRRTAQIDGNRNKVIFQYDPAGRMVKQTNALGNSQSWTYESKTGKLIERSNGEQVIRQSYDPKTGALASIDYGSGQKLTYTYDAEQRPLSATGPDTTFETNYDDQGRLTAVRAVNDTEENLLSYRYNRRGQRTGLMISKLAKESATTSHYETLQQTEQIYDPEGRLSYPKKENGHVSSSPLNGTAGDDDGW